MDKVLRRFSQRLEDDDAFGDPEQTANNVQVEHEIPLIPDLSQAQQVLGAEAAEALRKLCLEYSDIFSDGSEGVAATTLFEAPVDTAKGVVVCRPPYRQSRKQRQAAKKLVDELLEQGIVSRSPSPWAFPITIVKKEDGSPRFCVDFREVNKHLSVPKYPLPRIDDAPQCFEGKKYCSVESCIGVLANSLERRGEAQCFCC